MPSPAIDEATRRWWRELGFYYERDDATKTWRLLGTRNGLLGFAASLKAYASDQNKKQISEHEHFGPHYYLEVGTWHTAEITDHWIAGPLESITALANHVETELAAARPPTIMRIRESFAPGSPYEFQFELQPEGFDPALADPQCRDEA